jgi:acetylglutamate kinase
MEKMTLIKVGGRIVEEEETLGRLLRDFAGMDGARALVHGGGRLATAMAQRLGVESRMVDGRRVTDAEMLRIVTMVYAGLVNKNIVARLQALNVNAVGLTGADMNVMRSVKRPGGAVDYGFVGDVEAVDADALTLLLANGLTPVLSPLTHDGRGRLLNTNADTIAGEAAIALAGKFEVTLVFCFEKRGVLRDGADGGSVIPQINRTLFEAYKAQGIISGGMIPKIENALRAVEAGVKRVVVTRASEVSGGGGTVVSL